VRTARREGKFRARAEGKQQSPPVPTNTTVVLKKCPAETPRFVEPMKARLVESLRPGENWLLELKHDGYRALAIKDGDSVELFSRSHRKMTAAFPAIVAAVERLSPQRLVIDGEIVALNESGHASFQLLQNRESISDHGIIVFYVFDLLNLAGRNVRDLPLTTRRELLQPLLAKANAPLRFSATLNGSVDVVLAEVKRLGLEGLIAKKPASKYEPGQRSGAWVKLKCVNEQEFVIGGYTPPKGSRDFFGALLVGYYENGKLMFASKVGTGYTQSTLRDLFNQFKPLRRGTCPFANLPTKRSGRFGQGVTASEMKQCTWLEPKLVAQVRFGEWTSDGGLRQPVFLGLREDKRAEEVTRERPALSTA
jgi:bifunctional non-homologous end joining protein LigD